MKRFINSEHEIGGTAREEILQLLPELGLSGLLRNRLADGDIFVVVSGELPNGNRFDFKASRDWCPLEAQEYLQSCWMQRLSEFPASILVTQNETYGPSQGDPAQGLVSVLDVKAELIVVPLSLFHLPETNSLSEHLFEWIDAYGPTLLLSSPPNQLLIEGKYVASMDELRFVVFSAREVYLPIFDGESFAIWRAK